MEARCRPRRSGTACGRLSRSGYRGRYRLFSGTDGSDSKKSTIFDVLDLKQKAVRSEAWFEYVHYCDEALFRAARDNVEYDTGPSSEGVHCPVLVIFGDKDTSSGPPEPSVKIIRRGLAKAGNSDLVVKVFRDADHSLCVTKTGGRKKEAQKRPGAKAEVTGPEFVEGYLDTMTLWMARYCKL